MENIYKSEIVNLCHPLVYQTRLFPILLATLRALTDVVDFCIKRIQMLIARLGEGRLDRPVLLNCDPLDDTDSLQKQLLKKLGSLITT